MSALLRPARWNRDEAPVRGDGGARGRGRWPGSAAADSRTACPTPSPYGLRKAWVVGGRIAATWSRSPLWLLLDDPASGFP